MALYLVKHRDNFSFLIQFFSVVLLVLPKGVEVEISCHCLYSEEAFVHQKVL
jgi:hypothetical protein